MMSERCHNTVGTVCKGCQNDVIGMGGDKDEKDVRTVSARMLERGHNGVRKVSKYQKDVGKMS